MDDWAKAVKSFYHEYSRMCSSHEEGGIVQCYECELHGCPCKITRSTTDEQIDLIVLSVQKWSKEHSQRTYLTDFLEKFPNAPLRDTGCPLACRAEIFGTDCDENNTCERCWNELME